MKKHFLFLIVLIFIGKISLSQNSASCVLGDTLRLNLTNYRGVVSWQQSVDNQNWTDISASSAQLRFVPNTTTKWVRAKIEEENCPSFYETPFIVTAVDTAASGFQRLNLSVEQLPVELVSEDGNGLLIFDLNGNEFPLNVGDWLAGFAGQLTMKQIDAIIIQEGFAKLYTSSTSVSVYDIPLNFGIPTTGKVMGRVLTEAGEIVIAAKVKIGTDSVYTDFNGVFIFDNAAVFQKMGYVTVSKTGYFPGSRTFIPKPNGTVVEIRLLQKNLAGSFSSSSGGSVALENLQLQFPANAIKLNGSVYNGNVNVFVNYIDPASSSFHQEMPGNLVGNQNGNFRGLTSYGMIGVEINDSLGQKLQIDSGETVTAYFTLTAEMLNTAPDTIDLWSFNEIQGIWINEGIAIKNGTNYVAQLSHFSFWNCDISWEVVFLNGVISDEDGNPVSGITVKLSTPTSTATDLTNSLGQFGGWIPASTELNMNLYYPCGSDSITNIVNNLMIGPYASDTVIFIQNVTLPSLFNVFGTIQNCENLPIDDAYVVSSSNVSFLNQGNFTFFTCSTVDSIRIVKMNPFEFGNWQTIYLNDLESNLGILTLCGGDTLVTDTVSDIDGNIYNTVLVGDQWWMTENLKATHYSNGLEIPNLIDSLAWLNATSGAMCDYDNLALNTDIYGKMYNGFAATNSDNVCPIGWHVPTKSEWEEIISFAGGMSIAGGKLKSLEYWNQPNVGAENAFGFSALPGGTRYQEILSPVVFGLLGEMGMFWTSTIYLSNGGIYAIRIFNSVANTNNLYNPFVGYSGGSIRCVKN